tara:strand:+ start:2328 stop:2777 length:450 start_codon:yes stop_codon:yes gene_type:complete
MKKFLIILLLFVPNCGYQPLYVDTSNEKLIFQEINLEGDKKINRKIISALNISKSSDNANFEELFLASKKNKQVTSKNSKGEVISYKMTIDTNLIIQDKNGEKSSKSFNVDFSYNTKENKFDLAEYETQIQSNLIKQIIESMIVYINLK